MLNRAIQILFVTGILSLTFLLPSYGESSEGKRVIVSEENVRNRLCVVLQNEKIKLALDSRNFTLVDMQNISLGESFVAEPGSSLFRINFDEPRPEWFLTDKHYSLDGLNASRYYYRTIHSGDAAKLELHYDGCPITVDGVQADVTVTIELEPDDNVFCWSLSYKTNSSIPVGEIRFPIISGLGSDIPGSDKKDYLVISGCGQKVDDPRSKGSFGQGETEFPAGGTALQMVVYCDGVSKGSLYLAALDTKGYRKTFVSSPMLSKKSFSWYILHYPDGEAKDNAWQLPYKVVCGPITGDWYDAGKIYRKWALSQPKWKPLYTRSDIPKWFRELSVWYQGQDRNPSEENMAKHVERLLKIRDRLGEDYAFHWYLWQKYKEHDYRYPDYFPSQPGFKEAIQKVQKAGVHVMPYFNVELFDTMTKMWTDEDAQQWASRDPNGNYNRVVWEQNRKMVNMCPGTQYWQDKLIDIGTKLAKDYGVDAVYLDELHVYPYLCYAKNHLHSGLGGTYFVDGYRNVINRIRKNSGRKDLVITGEGCSDTYSDLISGQLVAHYDFNPESLPLFETAMHDCTVELGLTMNRDEAQNLDCFVARTGFALVRGRQLGWFNFDQTDMMDPGYNLQIEFLKKAAHCRKASLDFLFDGEFLRTPELPGISTHLVKWYHDKEPIRLPDVFTQAYLAPNGDLGIVAVNTTQKAVSAKIQMNPKDWPLHIGNIYKESECLDGIWSKESQITLVNTLNVDVPAYTPLVIRLRVSK